MLSSFSQHLSVSICFLKFHGVKLLFWPSLYFPAVIRRARFCGATEEIQFGKPKEESGICAGRVPGRRWERTTVFTQQIYPSHFANLSGCVPLTSAGSRGWRRRERLETTSARGEESESIRDVTLWRSACEISVIPNKMGFTFQISWRRAFR